MANTAALNDLIVETVQRLPDKDKREVFAFIEFLQLKKQRPFIEYVNQRTSKAIEARKQGEHFTSLEELQREYA